MLNLLIFYKKGVFDLSSFYNRYLEICTERKIAPSAAAQAAGFSRAAYSGWGKGSLPSNANLVKLAKYFQLPVSTFSECDDIKARDIKSGIKAKLESIIEEDKKNTVTRSDGKDTASADRHAYVNNLFDQLTFENQIDAIDFLKSKLRSQVIQDNQKESD